MLGQRVRKLAHRSVRAADQWSKLASNCVGMSTRQAVGAVLGCHSVPCLSMAFRMISSLRMQEVSATFLGCGARLDTPWRSTIWTPRSSSRRSSPTPRFPRVRVDSVETVSGYSQHCHGVGPLGVTGGSHDGSIRETTSDMVMPLVIRRTSAALEVRCYPSPPCWRVLYIERRLKEML